MCAGFDCDAASSLRSPLKSLDFRLMSSLHGITLLSDGVHRNRAAPAARPLSRRRTPARRLAIRSTNVFRRKTEPDRTLESSASWVPSLDDDRFSKLSGRSVSRIDLSSL